MLEYAVARPTVGYAARICDAGGRAMLTDPPKLESSRVSTKLALPTRRVPPATVRDTSMCDGTAICTMRSEWSTHTNPGPVIVRWSTLPVVDVRVEALMLYRVVSQPSIVACPRSWS